MPIQLNPLFILKILLILKEIGNFFFFKNPWKKWKKNFPYLPSQIPPFPPHFSKGFLSKKKFAKILPKTPLNLFQKKSVFWTNKKGPHPPFPLETPCHSPFFSPKKKEMFSFFYLQNQAKIQPKSNSNLPFNIKPF